MKLTAAVSATIALAGLLGCATSEPTSQRSTDICIVKDGKVVDASGHPMAGCVARFDGRMMFSTNGALVPMTKNMRMTNGTECVIDGTCIMKDGSTRKLKEGEVLTPEGKLFHVKGHKVLGASPEHTAKRK